MAYIKADQARSPRHFWTLIEVLVDQGESTENEGKWSLSIGEWSGNRRVGVRWNGTADMPAGNPQSRGNPTWFILPPEFHEAVMNFVPEEKKQLAKSLLK